MTMPNPRETALLFIDVQKGFESPYWGNRNNPDAEANMGRLLTYWREQGGPVYHVRHLSQNPASPLTPDKPGCAVMDFAQPINGEPLYEKTVNSAFIGTGLEQRLRDDGITRIVMVGLTTNHCVSTSARMAANLGFKIYVVADATATHDRTGHDGRLFTADIIHAVTLADLHGEFATVVNTQDLLSHQA